MTDHEGPNRTIRDVQDSNDDIYVLGLRENTLPNSWSLLFMEAEEDSDGDELDSYCIVVDPGQATSYGGVVSCEIQPTPELSPAHHILRLRLTTEAATELEIPTDTTLALELDDNGLALLRRGLRRVLTSGRHADIPATLAV